MACRADVAGNGSIQRDIRGTCWTAGGMLGAAGRVGDGAAQSATAAKTRPGRGGERRGRGGAGSPGRQPRTPPAIQPSRVSGRRADVSLQPPSRLNTDQALLYPALEERMQHCRSTTWTLRRRRRRCERGRARVRSTFNGKNKVLEDSPNEAAARAALENVVARLDASRRRRPTDRTVPQRAAPTRGCRRSRRPCSGDRRSLDDRSCSLGDHAPGRRGVVHDTEDRASRPAPNTSALVDVVSPERRGGLASRRHTVYALLAR